ncbi:GNAT family N-acetyltransferase [Clostridium sp. LP20]|uniref:GNAT family N-acetyltransferase n=1 Tax=Clostridium sp. LP20 TaxID=3418665 RepID=UPI003EE5CEE1
MCDLNIRRATVKDAFEIGKLIYSTENNPELEWGAGSKEELMTRLVSMIERENNRFSYQNIWVMDVDKIFAGITLALEGDKLKKSTFKADKVLITMQNGLRNKVKFLFLTIRYVLDSECKKNEFYISNIAIKNEFRGKGLAKIFLDGIYKEAKLRGFTKISLRANNPKLVKYYESLGYNLEKNSSDKMIKVLDAKLL